MLNNRKRERAGHFRKGLTDEWRRVISKAPQSEMDETLKTRLALAQFNAMSYAIRRERDGYCLGHREKPAPVGDR